MERLLYLATTDESGGLSHASLEALSGACELAAALGDADLIVGLIGAETGAGAEAVGGCGAARFLAVEGEEFGASRYSTDAAAATALVEAAEATVVLAAATSRLNRALPGVAQRVGGGIDTEVTAVAAVDGAPQVQRWYYRQRMVARVGREQRPWFILLSPGVYQAWDGTAASAEVETVTADLPEVRTRVEGLEAAAAGTQAIRPDANLLFVAGAGWTKKQKDGAAHVDRAEALIKGLLDKTSASLGSSKSLVEQSGEGQEVISFMTHMNQVGQTGSTPRHSKGLATCCHGEEPHVVGWRFINERRAINLDDNCGWAHGKADVLYVADAFEVLEELVKLL